MYHLATSPTRMAWSVTPLRYALAKRWATRREILIIVYTFHDERLLVCEL
jgi:hypothetical protein